VGSGVHGNYKIEIRNIEQSICDKIKERMEIKVGTPLDITIGIIVDEHNP
jgi:hypothetical protein